MIEVDVYDDETGDAVSVHINPDRVSVVASNPSQGRRGEILTDVMIEGSWFTLVESTEHLLKRI